MSAQPASLTLSVDPSAGVAFANGSAFVFDLRDGRINRVSSRADSPSDAFGRTGGGPGEFANFAQSERLRFYPAQWIDSRHDSIAVFDGQRISFFKSSGEFMRSYSLPPAISTGFVNVSRIRLSDAAVLVGVYDMGMLPSASERRFQLFSLTGSTFRPILTFPLLPLPKSADGRSFDGSAEAKPQWDLMGRCVVFSDGHSDTLYIASTDSRKWKRIAMPLPARYGSKDVTNASRLLQIPEGSPRALPPPSRPMRIYALSADPTGWVWILPVQPSGDFVRRKEVWRFNLFNGAFEIDTVAAFPVVFDSAGDGLGIGNNGSDEPQLSRVTARRGG